jgi:hypothetical protein
MTYQQSSDVYPLVYEMKIVDEAEFPNIVRSSKTLLDTDHTIAVVNRDMYAVMNTVDNSLSSGTIVKLVQQSFHEHYFVTENIDISGAGAMTYDFYTVSGIDYPPKTKIRYLNGFIYVMSLSDLSGGADFRLEQFSQVGPPYDLSLNWRTEGLSNDILFFNASRYDNHDLFGMFSPSGEDYVYTYYYDFSLDGTTDKLQHIMIHKLDADTGIMDVSVAIQGLTTGANNYVNGVIVDKPNANYDDLAIVFNTTDAGIQIAHVDIEDGVDVSIGAGQLITNQKCSMPITRTYMTVSGSAQTVNTLITYAETTDDQNNIAFADSTTVNPTGSTSEYFAVPYKYTINKVTRFAEAYNSDQEQHNFAIVANPLNPNFFYIAYITSAMQIRVVKFYRYKPSTQSNYEYLIMWATIANGTESPFMDPSGDFLVDYDTANKNSISMITDHCGDLYIFCRKGVDGEGYLRMWKLREYLLDFGQDEFGTSTHTDPTLFPDFLSEITDNYSILSNESSVFFGDLPAMNDVIISNVTLVSNNYYTSFKYLDYDIFQSPDLLDNGLTLAESFNQDLLNVLQDIYGSDANISIFNFDGDTETIFDGSRKIMTVIIPANNVIKPCVVRGTQIVAWDQKSQKSYVTTVEKIELGDYVMNQDAKPVKVINHTKDIIITDSWTSPYIIPTNYFGQDQPYTNLFISGDHGIRMEQSMPQRKTRYGRGHGHGHGNSVVTRLYPYTIKQGLKQVRIGTKIEYHHLKLENQNDFYMANGLLVESLRNSLMST